MRNDMGDGAGYRGWLSSVRETVAPAIWAGWFAGVLMALYQTALSVRDLTADPLLFIQDVNTTAVFLGFTGAIVACLGALLTLTSARIMLRADSSPAREAVAAGLCVLGAIGVAAAVDQTGIELSIRGWPVVVAALAASGSLLAARAAGVRCSSDLCARLVLAGLLAGSAGALSVRLIATGRLPMGVIGALVAAAVTAGAGALAWRLVAGALDALAHRLPPERTGAVIVGTVMLAIAVGGGAGIIRELDAFRGIRPLLDHLPAQAQVASPEVPNIVLISIDTLRPDFLGYNGGAARTPNIDRLAAISAVFNRSWTVAPWTRPSFASLFAGVYPSQAGVARYRDARRPGIGSMPCRFRNDLPTLAELLQEAGYFTAAVVTNPLLTEDSGVTRGFSLYHHCSVDEMPPGPWLNAAWTLLGPLGLPEPDGNELERADRVTGRVLDLIGAANYRPLLLWAHYMDPHSPYDPPTLGPEGHAAVSPSDQLAGASGRIAQSASERDRWVRAYTAEIDFIDRWIGELLDALRDEDLLDEAMIVFWSDHGEEFWEHEGWGHGHALYEEVMRIPLMIHFPGQRRTRDIQRPVTLLDVMPTVLHEAGVPAPLHLEGRPLQQTLEGRDDDEFTCWFEACCYGSIRKALLTERYKLVYNACDETFELYDLVVDGHEDHNIYGTADVAEAGGLEAELRAWTEESLAALSAYAGTARSEPMEEARRKRLRDMGYIQ